MRTNGVKRLTDNERLRLEALEPTGAYVLLRFDPVKDTTDAGLILPGKKRMGALTSDSIKAQQAAAPDNTGVVLKVGPEVEGVRVGERYLLTCPCLPVAVWDAGEPEPLGLVGAPDLLIRVKEVA